MNHIMAETRYNRAFPPVFGEVSYPVRGGAAVINKLYAAPEKNELSRIEVTVMEIVVQAGFTGYKHLFGIGEI